MSSFQNYAKRKCCEATKTGTAYFSPEMLRKIFLTQIIIDKLTCIARYDKAELISLSQRQMEANKYHQQMKKFQCIVSCVLMTL